MVAQPAGDATARAGAESVYRYLERTAEATPDGVRWQTLTERNEPRYAPSLYAGVTGITLFLADYHRLTGLPAARARPRARRPRPPSPARSAATPNGTRARRRRRAATDGAWHRGRSRAG